MRGHAHSRVSTQVMAAGPDGRSVRTSQKRVKRRLRVMPRGPSGAASPTPANACVRGSEEPSGTNTRPAATDDRSPSNFRTFGATLGRAGLVLVVAPIVNIAAAADVEVFLFSILLALATIIQVLRFQALRLREIAGATGD